MSLIKELKRRNVIRVGLLYAVSAWLVLQVADVLAGLFALPDWSMRFVGFVLLLGFPIVVVFSWVFELTPEGLKREKEIAPEDSITAHTARRLDIAVIVLLAVAIGLFALDRFGTRQPIETTSPQALGPSADQSQPASERDRRSVAVLPFTNRSVEEDTALFVDGVHDDLLTQLAKIGELKVISRTSVMEYRDTIKNLREIGNELGVATIMEGAVQRAGDRVRINAQLIDAETDEHLWAETYDRELTAASIFDIQTEIARAIASALQTTLSSEEAERLERHPTDNLDALAAYQRARSLDDRGFFSNPDAIEAELREALRLDPDFAAAWAMLARNDLGQLWTGDDDPKRLESARDAITKGRAADPDAPELDVAEGYYHYWGFRNYAKALEVLERALVFYPNDADLQELVGFINRRAGNFDTALEHLHRAHELNPRSRGTVFSLGETYALIRETGRAEEWLQKLEELSPTGPRTYQLRGTILQDRRADPLAVARQFELAAHEARFLQIYHWNALLAAGEFEAALQHADFGDAAIHPHNVMLPSTARGFTHLIAGNREAAETDLLAGLESIERALSEKPEHFGYLKSHCQTLGALGRSEVADEVCARALEHVPDDAYDRHYHRVDIATGLAMAGRYEAALDLIEEGLESQAGPSRGYLSQQALLHDLHDLPRWQALIAEPDS